MIEYNARVNILNSYFPNLSIKHIAELAELTEGFSYKNLLELSLRLMSFSNYSHDNEIRIHDMIKAIKTIVKKEDGAQMPMEDNNTSNDLADLSGDAFDKQFMKNMIDHHASAITMSKLCLKKAAHEELRTLAKNIISAQQKEIDELQQWLKDWYDITYAPKNMTE